MRSLLTKICLVGLVVVAIIIAGALFFNSGLLEKKNKSGLQVITNDAPVSIFINEEFLGKSPFLTKDLKPGEYSIKLEPENPQLTTYETTIKLNPGLLTVITWKPGNTLTESGGVIYELEKLTNKNQTELSLISIPDGAILSIDDGDKEFLPLIKNNLEVGSHEFEVSLPSYETQKHTLNIVKGHRLNVLIKLAKEGAGESEAPLTSSPTPPTTPASTEAILPTTAIASTASAPINRRATSTLESQVLGAQTDAKVLIKTTAYFDAGKEVLRVREASSSAAKTIGYAEVGQLYPYLNEKNTDWLKISFNNMGGWVSAKYAEIK